MGGAGASLDDVPCLRSASMQLTIVDVFAERRYAGNQLAVVHDASGRLIVDQGVEMKRPSRLYLDVADPVRVGGKVQLVAEGALV